MMTNSIIFHKHRSYEVIPGDVAVNSQNVIEQLGVVARVEPPGSCLTPMVYLTNGRILKLSTYGTEWNAIEKGLYSQFLWDPENKKAHAQHEVRQVNDEFASMEGAFGYRPHDMRLFLLTLHEDIEVAPANYKSSIVRTIVIAAQTFQVAMDYILSPERHTGDCPIFMPRGYGGEPEDPLKDCRNGWFDPRNIFCETIGITRKYMVPTILSVSREDTDG